jgi:hypothetical protein
MLHYSDIRDLTGDTTKERTSSYIDIAVIIVIIFQRRIKHKEVLTI